MANVRNGNSFYIDTQSSSSSDDLVIRGIKVHYIILTATAANGRLVLQDTGNNVNKCDVRVATSGACQVFDFSACPLFFPNGIKPSTLSNAVATLIGSEARA